MKIRARVIGAFVAILILFCLNLLIYFWSDQRRSASVEYLRISMGRQSLVGSIREELNNLQRQVTLLGQTPAEEAGSGGASTADTEQFKAQLGVIGQQIRQLLDLPGAEVSRNVEAFAQTWEDLSTSWVIVFQNLGVNQARAITELAVHSEPLSQRAFQQLSLMQEDERRRVESATSSFYAVAALTRRSTVVVFAVSILLAIGVAFTVSRYLTRMFAEEAQLLEVTTALSSELSLHPLLVKIMETTTRILDADRSTLFLYDKNKDELWSQVAQGTEIKEIRLPSRAGIAGSVFLTGHTVNIPEAYADPRFNPAVDKATGYRTHSILCMPVINHDGQTIGVTQVLNKKGGVFVKKDEQRLKAFSAQASIAIENAKLFDDVLNIKNYNESILHSLSNGVISLDTRNAVIKCNDASLRILNRQRAEIEGHTAEELLSGRNKWVLDSIRKVVETHEPDLTMDTEFQLSSSKEISLNMTVVPLLNVKDELIGSMLVFEDITREKRIKGTMARYMTREVAEKLLEGGESALGGQRQLASVLFSDIRNFTNFSETIGSPEEVVSMLNEYFSIMVDIIFNYSGILDKYIGDAIMAVFGAPFSTSRDADNAVRTAIDMMRALKNFNLKRAMEGRNPIHIGIGINTSELVSGNVGSIKRMDYTVIGDGVNLASRLEGLNKQYGTGILISHFSREKLADSYLSREVGMIRVKGKDRPVGVHEILDHHDSVSFPHVEEAIGLYSDGVAQYRKREWERAIERFQSVLRLHPGDVPSQIYIRECERLRESPPDASWDGVWVMTGK